MPRQAKRLLTLAASAGLILLTTACSGPLPTKGAAHKDAVDKADARWKTMRSNMMLQMATQQFATGDLDQAEKTINEALEIDKKNDRLYTLGGRVCIERGQLERAYHMLGIAIETNAKSSDGQYYQGLVLQRWQQYEGALVRYRQAYVLEPDNVAYLLAVTEMLVSIDHIEEARELLEEKQAYFDQNAGVRGALGQVYLLKGQPEKAIECFKQASVLRPDDAQTQEQLGQAQAAAGKHIDAIATLEKLTARAEYANRRDVQMTLASSLLAAGRTADAKSLLVKLTRSNPSEVEGWIKLGQLCWSMEDTSGTLTAASRVIALSPRRHEGYLLSGLVWQKRGELDKALPFFDQAATAAPDNALPLVLRGLALEKAGRPAAALESYNQALQRKPEDDRVKKLQARLSAVTVTP